MPCKWWGHKESNLAGALHGGSTAHPVSIAVYVPGKLLPQLRSKWCPGWDSNPQHPASRADASTNCATWANCPERDSNPQRSVFKTDVSTVCTIRAHGAQGGIRTRRNQCLRLARLPIAPPGLITRQKTKAPSDVIAGGGRIQAYVRVLHAVLQLAAVRKQITQA